MAPPSTSTGAGGDSPSRPSLAGAAEVSAPSSPLATSTGDDSGAGSESSSTRPGDALDSVLGAAPRSAADAPEVAHGADSADSQPPGSVSSSGVPSDGTCSAVNAPEASFVTPGAPRFSSVQWEDIEDIVTAGTDHTVRQVQGSTQSQFLALARLVVDLNRRPPLRTDYELDQRLEAAGSLSDVVSALAPVPRSPAPWEYELTELPLLKLRSVVRSTSDSRPSACAIKLRTSATRPSRTFGALDLIMLMPPGSSWRPTLRWNRALKLPRPSSSAVVVSTSLWRIPTRSSAMTASNSRPVSPRMLRSSASSESTWSKLGICIRNAGCVRYFLGGIGRTAVGDPTSAGRFWVFGGLWTDTPGFLWASGGAAGKRAAKSSDKLRSAPPLPKKKQRLGRTSVDLKARKAAKEVTSAAVSSNVPSRSVPSSLPAVPVPTSSAPISGIAVSADSDVLTFASIPSGSDPPFSPIPRTPASPASSTASTASLPSTPVVSRGTEASVPVEIDDDGGFGADGAASEASVAPGGVFSSPVVSQPRSDGRPTRAASTTAGLRSMVAAENEDAPDAFVLGLATPSRVPAATQASVASSASVPDPAKSAAVVAAASTAVVTSASARRRVANTHTGPVPPARVVATRTPRQASASRARTVVTATLSTMPGTRSTAFEPVTTIPAPIQGPQPRVRASQKLPDLANSLLEPAFTAPGAQEAWSEILSARIPQPIASDRVTECSIAGIQVFADWEDPLHPWQRLRARLPESPCTFGADDFMPDKPISIRASGLAIVVKLWRQFTGRARFWVWCTPDASGKIKCPPEILLKPSMLQYSFKTLTSAPSAAAWTAEVVDLDARKPWRNCWVGLPTEHPFNTTFAPCNPSAPLLVPEGLTREEVGAAIVVNPALRQSHVTAPWVQEFSDARAQAATDASTAADSPFDASSARTPIPAADQASVQAELGATAPAQARLDILADLATTAEI
ncbi:unnamed protein product [Phytophthora fragariaefolia]|uniref:Unnamed protein product n=1 Tax=Phytophthora fragariaefolia TaxID=1490495 RepID=A0A9W7CYK4_9STRA|nr:unnamed protein product [Phytophthora fragariaefolia]